MSFEAVTQKLKKEKEQLQKELDHYKKEDPYLIPGRDTSNTLDDDIMETEGHDRITATRINIKQRMAEVDRALQRIEEGKYGTCEKCDKKISEDRLRVMTTAITCLDCSKK